MAALNLATLSVEVQATGVNEAERDINNLTNTIQNSGSSATQATGNMSNGFRGLGSTIGSTIGQTQIFGTSLSSLGSMFTSAGGMATLMQGAVVGLTAALVQMATQAIQKAIAGLTEFVKKGIGLASDLQEVQNVVETTFGEEGSDRINEWASTCGDAFGMTQLQMLEMSGQFGSILNGMSITGEQAENMSQQIVQLAGDIASFNNLDVSESFQKLRAGILGESEPIKSLGIIINETTMNAYAMKEGMSKTFSEMTENEKVMLRFNYILQQTSNAQGDFAKTSDSFSNSQKVLKNTIDDLGATLADGFLEQLGQFGSAIGETLKNLKPVVELIGNLVGGALQTLMNLLKPFIDTLNVILMILKPIVEFINGIVEAVKSGVKMITDSIGMVADFFSEKMGLVQKETGETVEYTTQKIKEETDEALGYVTSATDKWVKQQMDNYRKTLEERYGNQNLSNMIKIEELMAQKEKNLQKQAERTLSHYELMEKAKTSTLEEQLKLQNEISEKYAKQIASTWSKYETRGIYFKEGTYSADISGVKGWGNTDRGYATGTNYATQGWHMVGEQGRELVYFGGGEKVINNSQTEQIMNSGSTHNTFYVTIPANSVKEFVDVVEMCNNAQVNMRMGWSS